MSKKHLFCKFGLIGDNLELKKNVNLYHNERGEITKLNFEDIENSIYLNKDQKNDLMIPGLINSHTHIGDSFAKEKGYNKDLIDVVSPPNGIKHQLLRETPIRDKILGIKQAIKEMISNGITYFIDFRENSIEGIELLQKAIKDEKIHCLIFGRFNQLNEIKEVYTKSNGIGLASYHHLTDEMKSELKLLKSNSSKKIACHVAEVNRDLLLLKQIIEDDLIDIIIHGTQLEFMDLNRIQDKKIAIVLCPRSNGYFGVGVPPIRNILDLKIPISLGTDNVMINNLDLFEEMRYFYYTGRIQMKNKNLADLNAKNILKTVTVNAAKIFNIESDVGSISVGKLADLNIINLNDSNFYFNQLDLENFYSLLVQRTNVSNIKEVYIKGELIYERKG